MPVDELLTKQQLLSAGRHLECQTAQHIAGGFERGLGRRSLQDRLADRRRVGRVAEDRLLLGGEVVKERAGGDVSGGADGVHRHLVEPALQDQGQRRFAWTGTWSSPRSARAPTPTTSTPTSASQGWAYRISGVPFFVIDQRYGVPGAQDPNLFARALAQSADDSQVQT